MSTRVDAIVTGSSGFIGTHLCQHLVEQAQTVEGLDLRPSARTSRPGHVVDLRKRDAITPLAGQFGTDRLIHLAAMAEVVMPFGSLAALAETNISATANVLDAFWPRRVVFASSCAVYGNAGKGAVRPVRSAMKVLGAYGVSKAMAELACEQWAQESGRSAVALRFGNVIGAGCRGLIPFLVNHALANPDGSPPAQLRGQGRILRDYVPVEYVVACIQRAAEIPLAAGRFEVLNIGSGQSLSNREVASVVAATLAEQGLPLEQNFDHPIAAGESARVVLDVRKTQRALDLDIPRTDEVIESIRVATLHHLGARC